MTTMQTFRLWNLFVHYLGALAHFAVLRLLERATTYTTTRILRGYLVLAAALTSGDEESSEVTH